MPQALAVVQELLKSDLSAGDKLATVFDFDQVLGLNLDRVGGRQRLPEEIQSLVEERRKARMDRDWAMSDELRDRIQERGYTVQDSAQGMKVFKS